MKRFIVIYLSTFFIFFQCSSHKYLRQKEYDINLLDELETVFNQIDEMNTKTLKDLLTLQEIKSDILKKEKKRLTGKFGSSHSNIKEINLKIDKNIQLIQDLNNIISKIDIPVLVLTEISWVLRGRVTDELGNGIRNLFVNVFDKDLSSEHILGITTTNNQGYFELIYNIDNIKDFIDNRTDLFLKIMNRYGEVLYSTQKPLYAEAGKSEYLAIIINLKRNR